MRLKFIYYHDFKSQLIVDSESLFSVLTLQCTTAVCIFNILEIFVSVHYRIKSSNLSILLWIALLRANFTILSTHIISDYIVKKEFDRKCLEESIETSEIEWKARAKIKGQLAEIRARVYVEAVIGIPLGNIEEIIREKVLENNPNVKIILEDSPEG